MLTINLNLTAAEKPYRDFVSKMVITSVPTTLSPKVTGVIGDIHYDWGDGSEEYHSEPVAEHTFTRTGVYMVRIGGLFERLVFSHPMLTEIISWGGSGITQSYAIYDSTDSSTRSTNLVSVADDVPPSITDCTQMFTYCSSLVSVPLFDTSNVTSTNSMFSGCSSLRTVPLFNTKNVTNMYGMFRSCSTLETVPLFDTSNVGIMAYMFTECRALRTVPRFNTSKVTNMAWMFTNCINLRSNLSNWCVPLIPSRPGSFDAGVPTNLGYRPPVWGTCPA